MPDYSKSKKVSAIMLYCQSYFEHLGKTERALKNSRVEKNKQITSKIGP